MSVRHLGAPGNRLKRLCFRGLRLAGILFLSHLQEDASLCLGGACDLLLSSGEKYVSRTSAPSPSSQRRFILGFEEKLARI